MKTYLIANWKVNPKSSKEARKIIEGYGSDLSSQKLEVVVCPPANFLETLTKEPEKRFVWGAQNCFWEKSGPYTGEISAETLKSLGVKYVILGHSERREHLDENDEMINRKIKLVLRLKMKAIFCVGGGKEAKDPSSDSLKIVRQQLKKGLAGVTSKYFVREQLLVAFETPWALSTVSGNRPASPKLAAEAAFTIKEFLISRFGERAQEAPIIYGGSANASNVMQFIKKPNLDGFLVGGASLNPPEFAKMINLLR